jgi:peptidoglycan/LPS O-acetylase OafA/YrhL
MLFVATALGLAKRGFISVDGSYFWFAVVVMLAAAAAWLSWRFLERPMLALKKKRNNLLPAAANS